MSDVVKRLLEGSTDGEYQWVTDLCNDSIAEIEALAQQLAQACKERDEAKADAKTGWDAFRKLRQSVAEDRYPGMTGKISGRDK